MKPKLLTTKQYKLIRSRNVGVLTAGIMLSPAREASAVLKRELPSTCPMAGACSGGCLVRTGMTTKQHDTAALTDEQVDAVSGGPHYSEWGKNGTAVLTDEQKEGIIDPYYRPRPPVGPCGPKFRRR